MRQLSSAVQQSLESKVLTVVWHATILFKSGTRYEFNSHFDPAGAAESCSLEVTGPNVRAGAGMSATLAVIQHDAFIQSFLTESLEDCLVYLYLQHYTVDLGLPGGTLLLIAEVVDASLSGKTVTLSLSATGNVADETPWLRIASPLFNFLTPRGTVVTWGRDKIVIDR